MEIFKSILNKDNIKTKNIKNTFYLTANIFFIVKSKSILCLVLVLSQCTCTHILYSGNRNSMLRTRVISTRYGRIQGVIVPMDEHKYLKPVEVYLGVPYATPPIGSNRFAPTRAPSPWDGIKEVDHMGPVCPQRLPDISNETRALETMPKGRLEYLKRLLPKLKNQSEDCLYMNIYSPVQVGSILESKHPVLVYIHGESYEWNSGNPYDGTVLASYTGVIVISINYRLGILGFLNANPTPHAKARVANYGLMDQIAALHWIQQNVALFGGDPNNITMIGHGPGAACIHFLMISPTVVTGLFQRAVLLSGSALSSWALVKDPVGYSIQLAKQTNCTLPEDLEKDHELIVDCLRELPLEDLMNADIQTPSYLTAFGPSVDGVVVKTDYAEELLTYFNPNDFQGFASVSSASNIKSDKISSERSYAIKGGQNKYDVLFGVMTSEALWKFPGQDIQTGFEGDRRDKIIRTYIRNTYTYHLSEIFFTIINEYTEWERNVQHPINTRDATIQALSDAQYVAPMVQTGDFLNVAKSVQDESPRIFFYVFDYQTKDGDYPQRMGSVHGEELPYLFGTPLVDGLNGHFPKNYTKAELALSESFMVYIANFARIGNPNEHQRQELILPISRERNRFKSIYWDEYDTIHQKYLEIGMKPRMKNHYRSHQLSIWLRLVPEIHRAGMKDVMAKHNLFVNHHDPDLYEGFVRPDPLTRTNYMETTLENYRKTTTNNTSDYLSTTVDTLLTTCVSIMSIKPESPTVSHHNLSNSDLNKFEAASYTAYSTALSVTIAIGCSLLILNVLIFAGVYYQRDKSRIQAKVLLHQKRNHTGNYDISGTKHPHYFIGHSQSSSTIVDVEHQEKNSNALTNYGRINNQCPNVCHVGIPMPNIGHKSVPAPIKDQYTTLPRKLNLTFQQGSNQMSTTLPKSFMNTAHNIPDIQVQANILPQNGSVLHLASSPQRSHSSPQRNVFPNSFSSIGKQAPKRNHQGSLTDVNV